MGLWGLVAGVALWDWLLLLAIVVVLLYMWGTCTFGHFRDRRLPYLRGPLPFIGSVGKMLLGFESFADHVERVYREGQGHDLFGIFQFMRPVLVVRDLELIKVVTVKEFDHFTDHQEIFTENAVFLNKSVFALKGHEWRVMRSTLSPAFTSSKMRTMFKLMNACGEQVVEHVQKEIAKTQDGVFETDMKDLFTRFTNDVVATTAFGLQVNSLDNRNNEFYKMGRDLTNVRGIRSVYLVLQLLIPRVMEKLKLSFIPFHLLEYFHHIVMSTVAERQRTGVVRPDMLELLVAAREGRLRAEGEEEREEGQVLHKELTDIDMTAQAVMFFMAGFDPVSVLMCFSATVLALHPDVQQRLQREIDEVAGDDEFCYEMTQKLKYLDMVMNEVQRLYSGVPLDRVCTKDFTFPATAERPAYTVKKGELLWIPQHGIHRDAEYWPDPHTFDPERFSDKNRASIKPFAFMPFGLGPRICIGLRFAHMETKIALFHILKNFSFVQTSKTPKEIKFTKFDFINNNIEGGFWLGISPRK